jgi:predicted enzyme related to lactoylglutathione lyase
MARVTGIGGVFFKSKGDRAALVEWYRKHLGVNIESYGGAVFKWPEDKGVDEGVTAWHIADAASKWFHPSESSFMINYRVDNLDELLDNLRGEGVQIVGDPQADEVGKFAWILDPDGNKVELWQPLA